MNTWLISFHESLSSIDQQSSETVNLLESLLFLFLSIWIFYFSLLEYDYKNTICKNTILKRNADHNLDHISNQYSTVLIIPDMTFL